jgi:protein-disulfide isomerase/uncharacterized membrane protein
MDRHVTIARARAIALLAAIVGLGASVYLLVEYVTGQPGVCLTGSGCDQVRASAFAYPLGIPMPLFGVAFYSVAAFAVRRTLDPRLIGGLSPRVALLLAAAAGLAVSIALTAIEAFVIHAFCSWCLVQAAASVILFGAAVALHRGVPDTSGEEQSARRRHQALRYLEGERSSLRRTGLLGGGVTALAVSSLLVFGAIGQAPAGPANGSSLAPAAAPRTGTGAVEVVEFADFQCPACAVVAPILADLAAANEVTLVYRYFPLTTIHANAEASARAAAAAGLQGAFWPMAERLFAAQASWESLSSTEADAYFAAQAAALGLKTERWSADFASSAVAATIAADVGAANTLGLNATPTLYIGGTPYQGQLSREGIRAAIAQAAAS